MPIFRLPHEPVFPDPVLAEPEGLLAVGGDLSPERLLAAYSEGIFPWYSKGEPILWWSPDPRLVLEPAQLHISHSLRKRLRRGTYAVTFDCAFPHVIRACAQARDASSGTWITHDMERAFIRLHRMGLAHSAESWMLDADGQTPQLVGGVYGLSLGAIFFGESMFATQPDASKVAFVTLVDKLVTLGCELIDCQVASDHLLRFGAREISREHFLARLRHAQRQPNAPGSWRYDLFPNFSVKPT
ncbi:MAG: leucyl/phenylalanyl-tRNA--protein transferase [Magnetococcales bacterium]|nr:leucyl/phenylalanyl-tRNA--protein transferase [Magnetococcales bacterium]